MGVLGLQCVTQGGGGGGAVGRARGVTVGQRGNRAHKVLLTRARCIVGTHQRDLGGKAASVHYTGYGGYDRLQGIGEDENGDARGEGGGGRKTAQD